MVDIGRYLIGTVIVFAIYSFIALTISFYGIKDNKDQGIIGIYYMLTIFLSDAFFVLSKANITFDIVGYFFPLRTILTYMRGDIFSLIYSFMWLIVSFLVFYYRIKKVNLTR
jgi:ABC-2 type transport system permease protein